MILRTRTIALIMGLLFLAAADSLSTAPVHPGTFDWVEFGRSLRGDTTRKRAVAGHSVHDVAAHVARKLDALPIPPNFDHAGRTLGQRMFGPDALYLGNCGHTSDCLHKAILGAGIPERSLKRIVVLKRGADGMMEEDMNADHVVVAYLDRDGPVTFDLWMAGRGQKTFASFPASIWNGMPLAQWAQKMRLEGYAYAYCQDHPEFVETSPELLAQTLRSAAFR